MPTLNDSLPGTEKSPPELFSRLRYVDIHCHCLASVDDGPATKSEAVALCRALVDDGISTVIATPHQLGRFDDCNNAAQIRQDVFDLNEELRRNAVGLEVLPGADVRVDERICRLYEADEILTLADSRRYILLELPHNVIIDIDPLLVELSRLGIQAIISHPERHQVLAKRPEMLLRWLNHSAHLQITAASLLGYFGLAVQKSAWEFLSSGWACLVATDAHNLDRRRPCMKAAFERISVRLGKDIAAGVCIENPSNVISGRELTAVAPCRDREVQQ